jgi:hypothetical protein
MDSDHATDGKHNPRDRKARREVGR